jgi:hypothetical protein
LVLTLIPKVNLETNEHKRVVITPQSH